MSALLALAALLSFPGQNDPEAAGLQALDHQDYQQAENIFSSVIARDPKDYSALFNLALAETGLKKDEQAEQYYKQVLAIKPGLYPAQLNLGILYLRDHRAADALSFLREASAQKPNEPRPKRYIADSLLATGDFRAAADEYRQALALNPKLASAELGLGQSLLGQAKLDEALPHYRQATALDPALKSYLLEIAVAYSKAGRPDEAISVLSEFPDDVAAREELGRLYLQTNRPADAIPQFQAAVRISPTSANSMALATAYIKNNQSELASPILEKALAANPDDYDLHMVIGRIHRDKHDYMAAATQFVAAANLKPDSVEAWNEAVNAFVIAEHYPEALGALDKIHRLNAETAGDFYYRAIIFDKLHKLKPALVNYQHFLQLSEGKHPDQEFVARQRSRILEKEADR